MTASVYRWFGGDWQVQYVNVKGTQMSALNLIVEE